MNHSLLALIEFQGMGLSTHKTFSSTVFKWERIVKDETNSNECTGALVPYL